MPYTVRSSERTQHTASVTETKALLYLMNFQEDSDQIYYFVVDFFNDVTGMDKQARNLWDTQSKGSTGTTPSAIGKELVTLFKNFCSDIEFKKYILFVGGVSETINAEINSNVFTLTDLNDDLTGRIKAGLIDEARNKEYINNNDITDEKINAFLDEVIIAIDDKSPAEYVRSIVRINPRLTADDTILSAIFNEIRDKQSGKKNINVVENITIETCDEALNYCRHLTSMDIRLITLGRLINRDPFSKGVPVPFIDIYNTFPPEKRSDMIEDCKLSMCRALFNKGNADNFWRLFNNIYQVIIDNPGFDVVRIYRNLDTEIVELCFDFDVIALKYFIAIVKEGLTI